MTRLAREARDTIKYWDPGVITIAGYIREHSADPPRWTGDACGCPDDRCKDGYHHHPDDECQCLRVMLAEFNRELTGGVS